MASGVCCCLRTMSTEEGEGKAGEAAPTVEDFVAPETPKKKKKEKKPTSADSSFPVTPKSPKPRKEGSSEAKGDGAEKSPKEKKKKKKEKMAVEGEVENAKASDDTIDGDAVVEQSPKKTKKKDKDKSDKSPKGKKKESIAVDSAPEEGSPKKEKKKKSKSKDADAGGDKQGDSATTEPMEPAIVAADTVATNVDTMKAWRLAEYNADVHAAVDSLTLEDVPMPAISDENQILIKVKFASVNPIDYKLFTGGFHGACPIDTFPYTPGFDVAGIVAAIGSNVKDLAIGDHVIADIGLLESCKSPPLKQGPAGAFAQYAIVPQDLVVACNDTGDLKTVAGLPLAGLTVYQEPTRIT